MGHSHGGCVIAQALVQDADLCRRVAGVVFLSTPFLHARLLPLSKHLPKGPAFLAGAVCAMAVAVGIIAVLATATDWPEDPNQWLSGVALVVVFAGLFTWAVVIDRFGQWLGAGDGRLTDGETQAVARLVEQVDLGVLDQRDVSSRSPGHSARTGGEPAFGYAGYRNLIFRASGSRMSCLRLRLGIPTQTRARDGRTGASGASGHQ